MKLLRRPVLAVYKFVPTEGWLESVAVPASEHPATTQSLPVRAGFAHTPTLKSTAHPETWAVFSPQTRNKERTPSMHRFHRERGPARIALAWSRGSSEPPSAMPEPLH